MKAERRSHRLRSRSSSNSSQSTLKRTIASSDAVLVAVLLVLKTLFFQSRGALAIKIVKTYHNETVQIARGREIWVNSDKDTLVKGDAIAWNLNEMNEMREQTKVELGGRVLAMNAAGMDLESEIDEISIDLETLREIALGLKVQLTPPPTPPLPPPSPPPPSPPFILNGRTLYQDGDGWILLLAYDHVAGQNVELVSGTAPQSPTESYSHIWLTDLGLTADDVESVRFYCSTSAHTRKIHFSANTDWVKTAILTGSNSGNVITNWNTGTTKLDGHTAYLPDLLSHAYDSLTDFPFFGDSTGSTNWGHWGIRGGGSRWECDDYALNTANTLHQIWFKKSPPPSYTHYAGACVHGNNIEKFTGKTVEQCKEICSAMSNCVAFEFGVAYDGGVGYQAGDCQPQSSANSADCDGFYHNLDLYVKDSEV
jgi:hypothetical protein